MDTPRRKPPYDIGERSFEFACDIVRFCGRLQRRGWTARHVAWQMLRCGTSVGANVQEAMAPSSRRDFISRAGIALRECRETRFWLRIIEACALAPDLASESLREESRELVAILTTLVKKARQPPAGTVATSNS